MPKSSTANATPERLQLEHAGNHRLGVLDEDALGDLEHQAGGVEARDAARALDTSSIRPSCWKWRAEMLTLIRSLPARACACCHARACRHASSRTQPPMGMIRPVSSARGMNSDGSSKPALRVLPPDQRLDGNGLAAVEADDGLVVEDELAVVDRPLQLGRPFEPLADRRLQGGLVNLVTVLAPGFGRVHGHVRRLHQLGRVLGPALAVGDPDAGVDVHRTVLDHEGRPQVGQDPFRHLAGIVRVLGLLEQDGELVPAEPGRGVTCPQRAHQAPGHGDQQLVTGGVPQTVVDQLEVVEVEEQDGQRRQGPSGAGQGVLQPVPEQGPVGQTAQGVVEGLVLQLLLESLALGDITQGEDDPFHGGVAEEVVGHHLDVAPGPVPMADAPLGRYRRPGPEGHPAVSRHRLLHVVRVQEGGEL